MTPDAITAAFEGYVLSLGRAEQRTAADCQAILGAYELAIRLGGDPETLARVASPASLGGRIAEARDAPCSFCRVESLVLSAPALCGDCAQEIALPGPRG